MTFQLRSAESSDIESILILERSTENAPHWPLTAYSAIVEDALSRRCLIVAEAGDRLAGFAVGSNQAGQTTAGELESVVVAADCRRAGIGRALCAAVLDWCRSRGATEIELEVRSASVEAMSLYSSLGFGEIGRRPRYYREPTDDALLMRLRTETVGRSATVELSCLFAKTFPRKRAS
ncbi:MAG: GNAT family N-acetyltransferase [Acidobacteriota bacterium]|nr:GNAT family N-acetyltransferase [Acidobacteriota bacterium]